MECFPSTPPTAYGITLLTKGIEPHITYRSPDNDLEFYLNGGLAPWPSVTEGVLLDDDGVKAITTSFSRAPSTPEHDLTFKIVCTAPTPEGLRKVIRKWFAAWDPEKPGKLTVTYPGKGEWWCHPRLYRSPADRMVSPRNEFQQFTWSAHDVIWRSRVF